MSFGPSGAVQFQINKNNATRGVFFQREKAKNENRKFGYKSKSLRHPIRQPDSQEELERLQQAAEEEKRKFNKRNTDFIRRNRERYRPKEDSSQPPPGTTHIAPGTVTLTQDQLAALLKTLGKTSQGGSSGDNPLRISIDAENNKIEVEKYESDSNTGSDTGHYGNGKANNKSFDDDNASDVGIEALLNGDGHAPKPKAKAKKSKDIEDKPPSRSAQKSREGHQGRESSVPQPKQSSGEADVTSRPAAGVRSNAQSRLSWDDAKKMAGVGHVPDVVPWKHLTVGERKRLQWARERAEVEEEYNPWGRPGAGAPPQKQNETQGGQSDGQSTAWASKRETGQNSRPTNGPAEDKKNPRASATQRKKEDLAKEIIQLQLEIREAEKQRQKEGEKQKQDLRKGAPEEGKNTKSHDNHQSKKSTKQRSHVTVKTDERDTTGKEDNEEDGKNPDSESNLSKKEIERRKWLAELDKQREEQRMKKQMEKERDRAGLQDQWADRFVYHKSPRHTQPPQAAATHDPYYVSEVRDQGSVPGRAGPPTEMMSNAPPAAMRSSMVVGDGSLNEHRYDNKKAEEKRKWLQELEEQREAQRQAKQAQKDRDRQENLNTWADHYPSDLQKLRHNVSHQLGQHSLNTHSDTVAAAISPRVASNNAGMVDASEAAGNVLSNTQRTSSAPHPQAAAAPEDGSTFLRGQGVFVDPVTRREQEEKRRVHLEYQAQIKAQIEEKERQKREERERKAREDMEEERKLQMERDQFNKQAEMEQRKLREREEQRQKQLNQLKSAMDEAQERAHEEKTHKRLDHLQRHGHDVTGLKATYDEPAVTSRLDPRQGDGGQASPRTKHYDMAAIPGLDIEPATQVQRSSPPIQDLVDSSRFEPPPRQAQPPQARYPLGQSYTKEPYVEDRVLTPSRFRDPGKPRDLPDSPRREFGTQTLELKELQNILNSLPEDIQIEYKLRVEDALREKEQKARNQQPTQQPVNRKVHVKSAEDVGKRGGGKPPQGAGGNAAGKRQAKEKAAEKDTGKQRLAWNQKQRKTVVKNSERDPFYRQKKEQADERRARREKQLQYLQELNSSNIPTHHNSRSKSRHEHCSPRRDEGGEEPRGRKAGRKDERDGRQRSQSPNILTLLNNDGDRGRSERRTAHNSKSPAPSRQPLSTGRSSPPIPTVRHRAAVDGNTDRDPYAHANRQLRDSQSNTRYGDAAFLPASDGEFVPFMRTTEILDPARAEEPMAMSRENSRMERARRAYRETHNPADKGRKVEIYQDREREAALKQSSQNPLLNPGLVTEHPTARQDMILQQLSSLKQTLMARQKELETYMSPAELEAQAGRA